MQLINAFSLTDHVNDWLVSSRHPRILHIFDRACNLVNDCGDVLSIVTPRIGKGPFNLVVAEDICFFDHLSLESPISVVADQLNLGELSINTSDAKSWHPRPEWERLHDHRYDIGDQLTNLQITKYGVHGLNTTLFADAGRHSHTVTQSLISSLCTSDLPSALIAAQKLAGLGSGLTPAGDDFLMGAIYAAWIIHPVEVASLLAQEIANTAAPLTTSLSAAWLRSAGRGEAGILWHEFFDALFLGDVTAVQFQMNQLQSIGHTSGADALAGFFSVCKADV